MTRGLLLPVVLCASLAFARVIPPGQEEAISVALGRGLTLPGDCHWDGASITPSRIDSRYLCGAEKRAVSVVLRLRASPLAATAPGETRDFTLELDGGGPPELLPALTERLAKLQLTSVDEVPAVEAPRWLLLVPRGAWVLLLAALMVVTAPRVRNVNLTTAAAAVVFVAALGARLAVPWGPLDFSEPERIIGLWLPSFQEEGTYAALSSLFEGLLRLGFAPLTLYRFLGPLVGALTCALVVPLARAYGCSRLAATIAGLALASWPVHVRYSASANPGILAAALWVAVLLVLAAERLAERERLGLLLPLVVLCVYARPEGRFVALVLVPWLLTAGLPARAKVAFLAVAGFVLLPYADAYLVPHGSSPDVLKGITALAKTLLLPGLTPFHWVLLGTAGWFLGRPRPFARRALLVTVIVLLASTVVFGDEGNPLFGHWRYLLALTPLFALGVAPGLDALHRRLPRTALVYGVAFALTLAPLLFQRQTLTRPIDLQEEFQFVLRTAPSVAAGKTVVLEAPSGEGPAAGVVHFELGPALALALSLGPGKVVPADAPGLQGTVLFVRMGAETGGPFVAYQGLTRKASARRSVEPAALGAALHEERLAVAPAGFAINSQCHGPTDALPGFEGGGLADCPVVLTWYEVK